MLIHTREEDFITQLHAKKAKQRTQGHQNHMIVAYLWPTRHIVIDDHLHSRNIQSTASDIGGDQNIGLLPSETIYNQGNDAAKYRQP